MATRNYRLSVQIVLGLIVILLGIMFTLENLGFIYARDFLKFWPILLVVYGVSRIVQCQDFSRKMWGAFWALIGTLLVLDNIELISFSIWDLWPLILVVVGLSMIWGKSRHHRVIDGGATMGAADPSSTLNGLALLGGFKHANSSQDFRGGEATAIMGGCEIDLRKASITEGEATLHLVAVMGGIEIWVPEDWKVILRGVPLLGGFEDKTHSAASESNKHLVVTGYAIMGSVEIKN